MTKTIRTSKLSKFAAAAAGLMLSACCLWAQAGGDRVAVPISDPSRPVQLKAHLLNGGITVKGYDGKEVIVVARVRGSESSGSEGGMRRLQINSTGLTVEEENNQVRVSVDSVNRRTDLEITVPRRTSLNLATVNSGNIEVSDVEGEIDVNNTNGKVTLTNISGSVVADALNGRITATFSRVNPQKAMSFTSMNGTIDVTFPADLKANVSFRTENGQVLSDFEVDMQSGAPKQIVEDNRSNGGRYRVKIDKTVTGKINGGGPEIQFKNFNGSIIIRKAGNPI